MTEDRVMKHAREQVSSAEDEWIEERKKLTAEIERLRSREQVQGVRLTPRKQEPSEERSRQSSEHSSSRKRGRSPYNKVHEQEVKGRKNSGSKRSSSSEADRSPPPSERQEGQATFSALGPSRLARPPVETASDHQNRLNRVPLVHHPNNLKLTNPLEGERECRVTAVVQVSIDTVGLVKFSTSSDGKRTVNLYAPNITNVNILDFRQPKNMYEYAQRVDDCIHEGLLPVDNSNLRGKTLKGNPYDLRGCTVKFSGIPYGMSEQIVMQPFISLWGLLPDNVVNLAVYAFRPVYSGDESQFLGQVYVGYVNEGLARIAVDMFVPWNMPMGRTVNRPQVHVEG
jgi:hypothetical protein